MIDTTIKEKKVPDRKANTGVWGGSQILYHLTTHQPALFLSLSLSLSMVHKGNIFIKTRSHVQALPFFFQRK